MRKAFLLICLLSASAPATADIAQDLLACARIADDARRLACYDRFATQVIELGLSGRGAPSGQAAAGAAAGAAAASTAAPSSSAAPSASAPAASPASAPTSAAAPASQAATPAGSPEDQFGLDTSGDGPKRIRSRYVGDFTGWTGDTVFRLENGQVWQQAEQGRMAWNAENPEVTISRGMFGVYRLSVKGVNKKVKVKRLR